MPQHFPRRSQWGPATRASTMEALCGLCPTACASGPLARWMYEKTSRRSCTQSRLHTHTRVHPSLLTQLQRWICCSSQPGRGTFLLRLLFCFFPVCRESRVHVSYSYEGTPASATLVLGTEPLWSLLGGVVFLLGPTAALPGRPLREGPKALKKASRDSSPGGHNLCRDSGTQVPPEVL